MKVKSVAGQATCETRNARKMMNDAHKEHGDVSLIHARETFARVNVCEMRCTDYTGSSSNAIVLALHQLCTETDAGEVVHLKSVLLFFLLSPLLPALSSARH